MPYTVMEHGNSLGTDLMQDACDLGRECGSPKDLEQRQVGMQEGPCEDIESLHINAWSGRGLVTTHLVLLLLLYIWDTIPAASMGPSRLPAQLSSRKEKWSPSSKSTLP